VVSVRLLLASSTVTGSLRTGSSVVVVVCAVAALPAVAGGVVTATVVGKPVAGVYAVVVVRPSVRSVRCGAPVTVAVTVPVRSVADVARP